VSGRRKKVRQQLAICLGEGWIAEENKRASGKWQVEGTFDFHFPYLLFSVEPPAAPIFPACSQQVRPIHSIIDILITQSVNY
jgi:hypothetical protein